MKKRIKNILVLVVIAAAIGSTLLKMEKLSSLKQLFEPKKVTIDNTPVVVKQIRALAQLVTISVYQEMVVDSNATESKTLQVPLLPDVQLFSTQKTLVIVGKVNTHIGIDMQKLSNTDISGTTDSIHIVLPAAEVFDAVINPSDVSIFIEKGEWNNTAITLLKNKIQFLAVSDAQSRGLLRQAEDKARQVLTDFFSAAGYRKVVIQFKNSTRKLS